MPFFRNLFILTILLALGLGTLIYFTEYRFAHPLAYYILVFFAVITFITSYVVGKGTGSDPQSFQLFFMGSSVCRLFLCMIAVFIYVYLATDRELQFALNFFVFYFIYTGFEIYGILSNLRQISKKQVQSGGLES